VPIVFTVQTSIRACDFIQYFLHSKRNETQIKIQCCPVLFLVWFVMRRYRRSHCTASKTDGCLQIWSIGTITIGENQRAQTQASLSTTLSITSPIQNTVASNPDLRGEKPATNHLSYMVCYGAFQSSWQFQNTPVEHWEVIGYRRGVADVNAPGYNAKSRGNQFPTFRDTAEISSSRVDISKKNPADIFTAQFVYSHLHVHVLAFPSLLCISKNLLLLFISHQIVGLYKL